jgi:hypothetical protein
MVSGSAMVDGAPTSESVPTLAWNRQSFAPVEALNS